MTRQLLVVASIVCAGCAEETPAPRVAQVEHARVVADAIAPADADGNATVRVRFASSASPYLVEAAACSLRLGTNDGAHAFDMHFGERRCASTPVADTAIPIKVHSETSDGPVVVLESTALATNAPWTRSALVQVASVLEGDLASTAARLRDVKSAPESNPKAHSSFVRDGGLAFVLIVGGVALAVGLTALALSTGGGSGFHF